MKILAIDSTSKNLSICISDGNDILSFVNDYRSLKHMQNIIGNIDKAFMNLPFGIHDIDLFAVNLGPGDFTGSRIGISIIKTFSMLSGKDAFGFNALDVFAFSSLFKNIKKIKKRIDRGGRAIIIPLMDVRNNEIFFSVYEAVVLEREPTAVSIKDIFNEFLNQNVIFISAEEGRNILIKKLYDKNILINKNEFVERFFQLLVQLKRLKQYTCSMCRSLFAEKPYDNKTGKPAVKKLKAIDCTLTGNAFFSYSSIFEELMARLSDTDNIKIIIEKNNRYTRAEHISRLAFFRALTGTGDKNIAPFYVRDFIPFGK